MSAFQHHSPVQNVERMWNLIVLKHINNILHLFMHRNILSKNFIGRKYFSFFSFFIVYFSLKCNKLFPTRTHILQHQSKPSPFLIDSLDLSRCSSPPRVHYCYLCRTNFDTAIKMHIHLIEHQYPNHDYQCTLCDENAFDDASQLYHHMVQHGSKARLHPCRECDVFFMFSMHLINHQYSHAEEIISNRINGNSHSSKASCKTRSMINEEKKQSTMTTDEEENSCKSIVTRSATKGTCRSVIVT